MAEFVYVPDRAGEAALMRSAEVQDGLARLAERVAEAARSQGVMVENQSIDVPIKVLSDVGAHRARAAVIIDHPSGLAVEAKYQLLTRAVDAAT